MHFYFVDIFPTEHVLFCKARFDWLQLPLAIFFFTFKFDKINSAKFTNAGIFYNCQNEHFNIQVPLPII
jgi:hypothetical protein